MTDTALLPPMYAGPAIQFRDPFVSSRDSPPQTCPQQSAVWSAPAPYSHVTRPLTPPPEMAGAYAAVEPIHPANLHDHKHSEYERGQQVYRGPVPAPAREALGTTAHSNGQSSPYRQRNWEAPDEMPPHRRGSQHSNAIASPFQIPRSVNDSGGSLAELAAQVGSESGYWYTERGLTAYRSLVCSGSNLRNHCNKSRNLRTFWCLLGHSLQTPNLRLAFENG